MSSAWGLADVVIVWACDVCDLPVDDEAGYVTIRYADLDEHERAGRDFEAKLDAKYPCGPGRLRVVPLTEYSDAPGLVRWRILHRDCDPDPDSCDYWIGVERIRTQGQALEWCAHLLETKRWLPKTNWPRIVRVAGGEDSRPV